MNNTDDIDACRCNQIEHYVLSFRKAKITLC